MVDTAEREWGVLEELIGAVVRPAALKTLPPGRDRPAEVYRSCGARGRAECKQREWQATLHHVIVSEAQSIWGSCVASHGKPRTARAAEDRIKNN